jgi:hypothetical protein
LNTERRVSVCVLSPHQVTLKSKNTNRNIERIFLSVNFQEILLTKIFSRYISKELQWKKN